MDTITKREWDEYVEMLDRVFQRDGLEAMAQVMDPKVVANRPVDELPMWDTGSDIYPVGEGYYDLGGY